MYWGNFLINLKKKLRWYRGIILTLWYYLFLLEVSMKTNVIITIIAFVVISIVMYFLNLLKLNNIKKNKKKKGKNYDIMEIKYLMFTYNLKKERLYTKWFILLISIINAFIISIVFFTVVLIPWKAVWQLLIGFILLFGLIYGIYGVLGKILVMKGYDK